MTWERKLAGAEPRSDRRSGPGGPRWQGTRRRTRRCPRCRRSFGGDTRRWWGVLSGAKKVSEAARQVGLSRNHFPDGDASRLGGDDRSAGTEASGPPVSAGARAGAAPGERTTASGERAVVGADGDDRPAAGSGQWVAPGTSAGESGRTPRPRKAKGTKPTSEEPYLTPAGRESQPDACDRTDGEADGGGARHEAPTLRRWTRRHRAGLALRRRPGPCGSEPVRSRSARRRAGGGPGAQHPTVLWAPRRCVPPEWPASRVERRRTSRARRSPRSSANAGRAVRR